MTRLKAGIIGGGVITDMHSPGFRDYDKAEIYAVADIDEKVARRRAAEWGAKKWFTDYRQLLDDKDIDFVEIITPHGLHCRMVCDAAAAGKHVSVQKPMAMSIVECDKMIAATAEAGVKFKVFENFVFYPPYVQAKKMIDNGEIGDPLTVRMHLGTGGLGGWYVPLTVWAWRLSSDECGPGAAIFDDGQHKFSIGIDLFGRIDKVYAYISRTLNRIDSPAVIGWTYKDFPERQGIFDLSFQPSLWVKGKYYSADERFEIIGTKGAITITRCTAQLKDEPPLVLYRDGKTTLYENLRADWVDSFSDSMHAFAEAIIDDTEPHLTGERGKQVLQFSFAAFKAAETGQPVDPDDVYF